MMLQQRKVWTEVTKRRIAAEQRFQCNLCHQLLGAVWAADHIVPLHQGGTNAATNCQILCCNCHGRKTQQEQIVASDQRREMRLRKSKYWDPQSVFYMQPAKPEEDKLCRKLAHFLKENNSLQKC